jgi:hypothetical protein
LPVPAPAGDNQVAVVDISDDEGPAAWMGPVGEPARTSPEPPAGVLMMREDDCVMSGRPTHDAEALSSRAALPASGGIAARPEQERERVNMLPAHFSEAQAEQEL